MIKVSIDKLYKAKWNYKTDNKILLQKLIENIKKNGQIENIIIREISKNKYEVVNGNHRLDAFKALNIKEPWCYNLGKITESQAKRIAIETNETHFENDNIKLAELMKDITKDFKIEELALTMPYTGEEIGNFAKLLDFDWSQFDKKDVEFEADNNFIFIIKCNKKDKGLLGEDLLKVCRKYKSAEMKEK